MPFSNYLKGKTVCVVGAAGALKGSGYGAKIDSYDVVVRVNAGFPVNADIVEDVGKKTDVVCLGTIAVKKWLENKKLFAVFKRSGARCLLSVKYTNEIGKGFYDELKRCAPKATITSFIDVKWRNKQYREIGKRPPSGYIVIGALLRYDIKELHVTGYDFYRSGYYEDYGKSRVGVIVKHLGKCVWSKDNYILHRNHFNKYYQSDKRVSCDETLTRILNEK